MSDKSCMCILVHQEFNHATICSPYKLCQHCLHGEHSHIETDSWFLHVSLFDKSDMEKHKLYGDE